MRNERVISLRRDVLLQTVAVLVLFAVTVGSAWGGDAWSAIGAGALGIFVLLHMVFRAPVAVIVNDDGILIRTMIGSGVRAAKASITYHRGLCRLWIERPGWDLARKYVLVRSGLLTGTRKQLVAALVEFNFTQR